MESFEIAERTKLSVKIFGNEYEVLRPSVAEARKQLEKNKGIEDPIELMANYSDYLVSLGFPAEVIDSLEADQFWNLIGFVSGNKKNR